MHAFQHETGLIVPHCWSDEGVLYMGQQLSLQNFEHLLHLA